MDTPQKTKSKDTKHPHPKTTPMFAKYIVELVLRLALLAFAIFFFITDPSQLDIVSNFGFQNGLSFVDVAFVFLIFDMATKLFPSAKISMGSKKQWGKFHKPTLQTVSSEVEEQLDYLRQIASDKEMRAVAVDNLSKLPSTLAENITKLFEEHIARPVAESAKGLRQLNRQVARQLSTITGKQIEKTNPGLLRGDDELRDSIREDRLKEIVPVIVVWVLFNALVACLLHIFGWLTPQACLLWCLFYFVSDMICVVAWCPFQVLLMRNRCCTTCQIFNWDAIMAATPLLFAPSIFSAIIVLLALVVLVRWEVAFVRRPERFDERTNASLSCANCTDKMCRFRRPLRETENFQNTNVSANTVDDSVASSE